MPKRWPFLLVVVTTLDFVRSYAASSEGRIVGAYQGEVSPADVPFVCSVRLRAVHRCSGTVLNPNWLLTSGHCVYDRPALDRLAVVCGLRMYRTVAGVVVHPSYPSSPTMGNDLALLMMRKPLNFTSFVQPIPVFESLDELPAGDGASSGRATIVGFDRFVAGDSDWENPSLQMTEVAILSACQCRQRLGPTLAAYLTEANVCTDNEPGGSATCAGDSGAPVLIGTDLQTYSLLAVPAWTVAPCGAGPSVHVRVASHLDWILDVIALN